MINLLDYIRGKLKVHSPSKEYEDVVREAEKNRILNKAYLSGYNSGLNAGRQEAIFKKFTPNEIREACGLDPIIPVDKDKKIVKIFEDKSVIIQLDRLLSEESMKQIKEDIQKQIKENGFAVVDGRCKIIEFDNPKAVIETK